mgnify:CR=1 FL=1
MANVDSVEVSRFEDLATSWWDPEGKFKPLHQINPLRLDYIDQKFPLEGQNVLDEMALIIRESHPVALIITEVDLLGGPE